MDERRGREESNRERQRKKQGRTDGEIGDLGRVGSESLARTDRMSVGSVASSDLSAKSRGRGEVSEGRTRDNEKDERKERK